MTGPACPGVADRDDISVLHDLDPAKVSRAARAETRNREVTLPPITVYRWWRDGVRSSSFHPEKLGKWIEDAATAAGK